MVAAFCTGDLTLLRGAIDDRIAEPARAPLLPGFAAAKAAALDAGALRLLDLRRRTVGVCVERWRRPRADASATAMLDAYAAGGMQATARVAQIDAVGARVETLAD